MYKKTVKLNLFWKINIKSQAEFWCKYLKCLIYKFGTKITECSTKVIDWRSMSDEVNIML